MSYDIEGWDQLCQEIDDETDQWLDPTGTGAPHTGAGRERGGKPVG